MMNSEQNIRIAGVSLEMSVHGDDNASFCWSLPAMSSPSGVLPMLPRESELLLLLWDLLLLLLGFGLRAGSEIGALDLAVFSGFSMFGKFATRPYATVRDDSPNIDSNFEFACDDDLEDSLLATTSTLAAKATLVFERDTDFDDDTEVLLLLRGRAESRTTVGDSPSLANNFALSFGLSPEPCCEDGAVRVRRVDAEWGRKMPLTGLESSVVPSIARSVGLSSRRTLGATPGAVDPTSASNGVSSGGVGSGRVGAGHRPASDTEAEEASEGAPPWEIAER